MEISTAIGTILDRKGREVWSISPEDTVFQAIAFMAQCNVGALPVMRSGRLVGMISERDYARKVILLGKTSRETLVGDIMERDLVTIGPSHTVGEALALMTDHRVRHLPVTEEGRLAGIVSIGDLVYWIIGAQAVLIDDLEHLVTGAYPV